MIVNANVPHEVIDVAKVVKANGGRGYLVGGWARDIAFNAIHGMKINPKDCDMEVYKIESDRLRTILEDLGATVNVKGNHFPVYDVKFPNLSLEVSLPRVEYKESFGRRGFAVLCNPYLTIEEASKRRDFRMNALLYDPLEKRIYDPHGGLDDIRRKILRHIDDNGFKEDPLRVLRGMVFVSAYNLQADRQTIALCKSMISMHKEIPVDRIREEWLKWAGRSVAPSKGLRFLEDTGWITLYPHLNAMVETPQDPHYHPEGTVWEHTLLVVDKMQEIIQQNNIKDNDKIVLLMSALLHDIGKPPTTVVKDGRITSPSHDVKGEQISSIFLAQIGAPNWLKDRVPKLVRYHMYHVSFSTGQVRAKNALSLVRKLAPATIDEWYYLVNADLYGRGKRPSEDTLDLIDKIYSLAKERAENVLMQPIVNGRDIMQYLNIPPSPTVGRLLDIAREIQVENPDIAKEEMLKRIDKIYQDAFKNEQ